MHLPLSSRRVGTVLGHSRTKRRTRGLFLRLSSRRLVSFTRSCNGRSGQMITANHRLEMDRREQLGNRANMTALCNTDDVSSLMKQVHIHTRTWGSVCNWLSWRRSDCRLESRVSSLGSVCSWLSQSMRAERRDSCPSDGGRLCSLLPPR